METQEEYKPSNDTVISELRKMSENLGINTEELAISDCNLHAGIWKL